MDGLYQDVIIMLTIFVFGLIALKAYYKLKIDFDELQTDFHRLAEGREYVEDINSQAFAQGRTSSFDEVKALTFDTGGTILDWHSGFRNSLEKLGKKYDEQMLSMLKHINFPHST